RGDRGDLVDGAGHDDERHIDAPLLDDGERSRCVEARQRIIRQHDVPAPAIERLTQGRRRLDALALDVVPTASDLAEQELVIVLVVLDHEHAQGNSHSPPPRGGWGRRTPVPTGLSPLLHDSSSLPFWPTGPPLVATDVRFTGARASPQALRGRGRPSDRWPRIETVPPALGWRGLASPSPAHAKRPRSIVARLAS